MPRWKMRSAKSAADTSATWKILSSSVPTVGWRWPRTRRRGTGRSSPRETVAIRILTFLLVLAVAIGLFSQYLRRTGMFFPDRYPVGRWNAQQWMIVPSEHWSESSDGVRLHAWLFETEAAGTPVMIWYHGNAGNITDRAEMCAEFAKRGVAVFIFDYRGFGRSEGRTSEWKTRRDALAAFDYVQKLGPRPIVLYGESIG